MTRKYTVVGLLCTSREEAVVELKKIQAKDPRGKTDWGLIEIDTPRKDGRSKPGKIHFPFALGFLETLERLLVEQSVSRTKAGAEALKLVRSARKRRK